MTDTESAEGTVRVGFIGDSTTAIGYRLAGVVVDTPGEGDIEDALDRMRACCDVVFLAASHAARLSKATRELVLAAERPLTVVVPDARGEEPMPDLARAWQRQLGVEP